MVKIIPIIATILVFWSLSATAQEGLARLGSEPAVERLRAERIGHCAADLRRLCPGIPPGDGKLLNCMREHIRDVSLPCLVMLSRFAAVRRLRPECGAHLRQQCAGVKREGGEFEACLKSAVDGLSDACKDALAKAVAPLAP